MDESFSNYNKSFYTMMEVKFEIYSRRFLMILLLWNIDFMGNQQQHWNLIFQNNNNGVNEKNQGPKWSNYVIGIINFILWVGLVELISISYIFNDCRIIVLFGKDLMKLNEIKFE